MVRDTLEQIDIARRFIGEYPGVFEYCPDAKSARKAFNKGKIASMIGIEGGHQVGSKRYSSPENEKFMLKLILSRFSRSSQTNLRSRS